MKRFAYAAALASLLAVPAFAQSTTEFAIMHFNMDADNAGDMRMAPMGLTTVELSSNSSLAEVFDHLNMDADNMMDVAGQGGGVTIIMSDPSHASDIFMRLMEESSEDE